MGSWGGGSRWVTLRWRRWTDFWRFLLDKSQWAVFEEFRLFLSSTAIIKTHMDIGHTLTATVDTDNGHFKTLNVTLGAAHEFFLQYHTPLIFGKWTFISTESRVIYSVAHFPFDFFEHFIFHNITDRDPKSASLHSIWNRSPFSHFYLKFHNCSSIPFELLIITVNASTNLGQSLFS